MEQGTETRDEQGLSAAEVEQRRALGQTNTVDDRTSRTVGEIVHANIFTRFNALVSVLWIIVLIYGELPDALFGGVMILNAAVGIVQELRAKRSLDSLREGIEPKATVLRDGAIATVPTSELVLDDIVTVSAGDQIPVDGKLSRSKGLEVDESSLTGEADPTSKAAGDEVWSGTVVVAGEGTMKATAVGADTRLRRLTSQAREFTLTQSELRRGIDTILRWTSWVVVPVGVLLFITQTNNEQSLGDGLVSAVAGVVAIVPQGLVLLSSMSMAVAVIRLSREHVITQELPAVEGLARVDVICLDKTGTLTTGNLIMHTFDCDVANEAFIKDGMAALAASDSHPTSTMAVIAAALPHKPDWQLESHEPFSSARKWSSSTFDGHGCWILGAPEVLLDASDSDHPTTRARVGELAARGERVLLLAHHTEPGTPNGELSPALRPVAVIGLVEQLRDDAAHTLRYFANQGVIVKIISGDNPHTVSAIAKTLGVAGAEHAVDLRTDPDIAAIAAETVVFGRAQPEQKRIIVETLQQQGHAVAMTGDGVNDIPALKKADIGIAMDTATPATKAIAQLILLDGHFDRLPVVIAEGRRVIANMELVSALFITKSIYATLLAISVGIAGFPYPFLPRHLSLVGALTIGIPAFMLSFKGSKEAAHAGYLDRTLRFSIPAGITAGLMTFVVYGVTRSSLVSATQSEARTAATVTLTLVGFWIIYRLIRPIDRYERMLIVGSLAAFVAAFVIPLVADFYALDLPEPAVLIAIVATTLANIGLLEALLDLLERKGHALRSR